MTSTIAVVDYGMGNLRSVAKAMVHVAPKSKVIISSSASEIDRADRIVFPGQGAARDCMRNLDSHKLTQSVALAFNNKPFLGICMGLQVLFDHSVENNGVDCLGLIDGDVRRFVRRPDSMRMKVPHMGWNEVAHTADHPLWNGIDNGARFYFVHSYYVAPQSSSWDAATTDYLIEFTSAVAKDNVFATQFHPEKSAGDGLRLLENFTNWKIN